MKITLDFETFSEADLRSTGAIKYSMHPSTEVLCVGYKLGSEKAQIWLPKNPIPYNLFSALITQANPLVAHNAGFERAIWENVLKQKYKWPGSEKYVPIINPDRWYCTAAKAASFALPRNLEEACIALKLPVQKDMSGRRLMLKYAKPRRPSKHDKSTRWNDEKELNRIYEYCKTDVEAEYLLDHALPDLPPTERAIWLLDQEINFRGIRVDLRTVKTVLDMLAEAQEESHLRLEQITKGKVTTPNQIQRIVSFLQESDPRNSKKFKSLSANAVKDLLADKSINPVAKKVLSIRQSQAKSSTKKYQAFVNMAGPDARVRDLLMYHGASTGRWAGKGIQIQNFPKGTMKVDDLTFELIREGDRELLKLFYGNPLGVFSSALRGMLIPTDGHEFFCADYVTIEVRVLFWLAGHQKGLEMLKSGKDLYKVMASYIYGKPIEQVDGGADTGPERDLGKAAVLGCGYQMGWQRFLTSCAEKGMVVDKELAKRAVKAYREMHFPIPKLWRMYEQAAIYAVKNRKSVRINKVRFFVERGFLFCELPSGRRLAYYRPSVKMTKVIIEKEDEETGELYEEAFTKEALNFWSQNSLTRKWEEGPTYGGMLTENIDQAIARDVMAEAMLRLRKKGYFICASIHDELLGERKIGEGSVSEFEKIMAELPAWAKGIPVKCKGWSGMRYKK